MQRSNTNTRAKHDPWLLSLETNGKEGLFTWHWDKFQYRMKFILHSHGAIKNTDSAQDALICLVFVPDQMYHSSQTMCCIWFGKFEFIFSLHNTRIKEKKEKEFYMDWKLKRSLSGMTCKEKILALVSFNTLETKRNLGHVNFSKDLWDCYWGQGKQIAE